MKKRKCEIKLKGGIVIKAGKTEYVIYITLGGKTMGLTRTIIETMLDGSKNMWDINDRILKFFA